MPLIRTSFSFSKAGGLALPRSFLDGLIMKAIKKNLMAVGVIALAASVAAPSYAADPVPLTFLMNISNNTGFPNLNVASLTISTITGGTRWTMEALYKQSAYPGAYIKSLDFSYTPPPDTFSLSNFQQITGTVEEPILAMQNVKPSVNFNTANNSDAALKFTGGEKVSWDFAGTNLSQFSGLITHVNAIYDGKSVKFSSAVPEPETYAMWLAGLGVLALLSRRQKKASSENMGLAC